MQCNAIIESDPTHPMLTSLLDLVNNKATAAAGFQNVPIATPKHHGPEGRNDLQINRKNKFPGGRNVPSEIVLEILSNPAIPSQSNPSDVDVPGSC